MFSSNGGDSADPMMSNQSYDNGHDDDSLASTTRTYLDKRTQIILLLSGIRGAVSFALVESIPVWDEFSKSGSLYKTQLKAMTCSSIFFTLFVFGALTYVMVQPGHGRVAGPLTHRLLSEPLDSGGEEDTMDASADNMLEIEPPNFTPQRQQYRHPDPVQFLPTGGSQQQYSPVPSNG